VLLLLEVGAQARGVEGTSDAQGAGPGSTPLGEREADRVVVQVRTSAGKPSGGVRHESTGTRHHTEQLRPGGSATTPHAGAQGG
jgi:hypothetical protein